MFREALKLVKNAIEGNSCSPSLVLCLCTITLTLQSQTGSLVSTISEIRVLHNPFTVVASFGYDFKLMDPGARRDMLILLTERHESMLLCLIHLFRTIVSNQEGVSQVQHAARSRSGQG